MHRGQSPREDHDLTAKRRIGWLGHYATEWKMNENRPEVKPAGGAPRHRRGRNDDGGRHAPRMTTRTILAGDVGGTKTWLGLFDAGPPRPEPIETARYATLDFDGLAGVVSRFLDEAGAREAPAAACFGVAGPVRNGVSRLTNVPWTADAREIRERFGLASTHLVNDLEAMGWAVPRLAPHELAVVHAGVPAAGGNAALIAPGTGLGEAGLHRVGGRLIPMPSEGGHADFAARTPRELEFAAAFAAERGRVSLEDVVSGPGLVNLHAFTHRGTPCTGDPLPDRPGDRPAAVTAGALAGACAACSEALRLFVAALGAAAGNLALRTVATAGVYIGGGIVPRLLPAVQTSAFVDAFLDKHPMRGLLEQVPVRVILEERPALLGAAVAARELSQPVAERRVAPPA